MTGWNRGPDEMKVKTDGRERDEQPFYLVSKLDQDVPSWCDGPPCQTGLSKVSGQFQKAMKMCMASDRIRFYSLTYTMPARGRPSTVRTRGAMRNFSSSGWRAGRARPAAGDLKTAARSQKNGTRAWSERDRRGMIKRGLASALKVAVCGCSPQEDTYLGTRVWRETKRKSGRQRRELARTARRDHQNERRGILPF